MLTTILRKRPLAAALAFFLITDFFIQYLRPTPILLILILLPFVCLLILLLAKSAKHADLKSCRTAISLILAALLLGATLGGINNAEHQKIKNSFQETELTAIFKTKSIQVYDEITVVKGILIPENEENAYKTILYFFGDTLILLENDRYVPLEEGDVIKGCFQLSYIEGNTLNELSSYADGYTLTGSYQHSAELVEKGTRIFSLKTALSELFDNTLSPSAAAVMKSLLLADKSTLSQNVKENFSALGISHLFAVSGLHLTVLIGMFAWLFSYCSIGKRRRYLILTAIILLYAVLTDFTPSLLRAGGMLLLFYLSEFIGRHRDPVTSLFAATACITLVSRRAILDVGLLLSFLATFGILTLAAPVLHAIFQRYRIDDTMQFTKRLTRRITRAFISASILTLAANAFILPLLLLVSGSVFVLAPLSNLIFAPLFTLLLYLIPIFLLTCKIPLAGGIVTLLVEMLSNGILSLSYLAVPLKHFTFSLDYRFVPYLTALVAAVAIPFLFFNKKKLALVVLSSVFLLIPLGAAIDTLSLQNVESVSYLSDGTNDLVFIEYETRRLAIVFSYSDSFVKNTIGNGKLTSPSVKCDTLMLANPSEKQTLLIYGLWEAGLIKHLILPQNDDSTDSLTYFAEKLGITVTRYAAGDTVIYNGIAIETHAATTNDTYALSIALKDKTLLYIRENAPNDFDIRFGILKKHHDVLIRGAYGSEMKGSLIPLANEIWEYEPKGYLPAQDSQNYYYGNRAARTKRE